MKLLIMTTFELAEMREHALPPIPIEVRTANRHWEVPFWLRRDRSNHVIIPFQGFCDIPAVARVGWTLRENPLGVLGWDLASPVFIVTQPQLKWCLRNELYYFEHYNTASYIPPL